MSGPGFLAGRPVEQPYLWPFFPSFPIHVHSGRHTVRPGDKLVSLVLFSERHGIMVTGHGTQAAADTAVQVNPIVLSGSFLSRRLTFSKRWDWESPLIDEPLAKCRMCVKLKLYTCDNISDRKRIHTYSCDQGFSANQIVCLAPFPGLRARTITVSVRNPQ